MSKIEEAIRKASLRHQKARRQANPDDDGPILEQNAETLNRMAPVLFRLQAGNRHFPSAKVLEKHRIIHDGFEHEALNNYKMLRTRILQEYTSNDWKTLAITAPHDGAGKTVTAINLAITLASHGGHEVFLVDLDLRNPSIADYFDLPADIPGLASYLNRQVDLSALLWDVGVENLVVLANRDRILDSSERITSKPMRSLINSFRTASPKPIVIFDVPPVLSADDAVAMAPFIDGMLIVVSERETQRDDLAHGLDLLRGANVLGVVLNKAGKH